EALYSQTGRSLVANLSHMPRRIRRGASRTTHALAPLCACRERPRRRTAEERDELASSHVRHRLAPLCTLTTARAANLPHVQPGAEVNWFTRRRQTLTKNYWRRSVVGAML